MEQLLELLKELDIKYIKHDHPAVYTVEEAKKHDEGIDGLHCKNMFLKDKKGQYFLFSTLADKRIDLKQLRKKLGVSNLSFASAQRLDEVLKLTPGSVCPFGIINDKKKIVKVVLDKDIIGKGDVNFHPLKNTSTITLDSDDLLKFIKHQGNDFMEIEME